MATAASTILARGYLTISAISDGDPAVIYVLLPGVESVTKKLDGTLSVAQVDCSVYKVTGAQAYGLSGDHTLSYLRTPDGATGTLAHDAGTSLPVAVLPDTECIEFELSDGTNVIDRVRVPVLSDATDVNDALDGYAYLREALKEQGTTVDGGLVLTSLMALGYTDAAGSRHTMAGTNGVWVPSLGGRTIGSWWGGPMVDLFDADDRRKTGLAAGSYATSLVRMDGSAYFANGNIRFRRDGTAEFGDTAGGYGITLGANGRLTLGNGIDINIGGSAKGLADSIASVTGLVNTIGNYLVPTYLDGGEYKVTTWAKITDGTYALAAIKATEGFFSDKFVSARGANAAGGSGGGGYDRLDAWGDYGPGKEGWVLSAALGAGLKSRLDALPSELHGLTVQRNGVTVGTYSPSAAATVNITDVASAVVLAGHTSDTTVHITADERTKWNKVVTDFAAITGADSDSVINKWEEVVAFLDTYTEADTLANLLSNKADKATTLGGYGIKNAMAFSVNNGYVGANLDGGPLSRLATEGYIEFWDNTATSGAASGGGWFNFRLGELNATKIINRYGTANHFLKADGSLDGNSYALASALGNYVTLGTNQTITGVKTFDSPIIMGVSHYIYGVSEVNGAMLFYDGTRTVIGSVGDSTTKPTHLRSKTGHLTCGESASASYNVLDTGNYASVLDGRYLLKSAYTAADVLSKMKTVDGAGSGLDADLLDGYHEGVFVRDRELGSKHDYEHVVFLLWKESETGYHHVQGKLFTRTAGSFRYQAAAIDVWFSRWSATGNDWKARFDTWGMGTMMRLVRCTYNGEKWWAVEHTNTMAVRVYFAGTATGAAWTMVHYYTSNTGTVVNAEVNSSREAVNAGTYTVNGVKNALVTDTVANAEALGGVAASGYVLKSDFNTLKALFDSMFTRESDGAGGYRIKANYGLYTEGFLSARGANPSGGGAGGGLVQSVYGWSGLGGTYSDSELTDTFNAYTINKIHTDLSARIASLEGGSALSVVTTGSGNAVTAISKSGTTITATKGAVFALQSALGDYYTKVQSNGVYARLAQPNNLVHSSNEVTMIPDGFTGQLWFNFRTTGGTNGNLSMYHFGNGAKGYAKVTSAGFIKSGSSDSYLLLGGGGHKALSDITGAYVTALGVSGDSLTWTRNGAVHSVTVPYATGALQLRVSANAPDLNALNRNGIYSWNGASNAPSTWGTVLQWSNKDTVSAGVDGLWVTQLASSTNGNLYYRRRVNTGSYSAWEKVLTDGNYSGVLDGRYYTESEVDAKLTNGSVTKVGTATVGSATRPIYLNGGVPTAGTYAFGNASGNAAINNGTLNANLNADLLDGAHADDIRKSVLAFKTFTGASEAGGYDLNTLAPDGGLIANYGNVSLWANAPTGATYGIALHIPSMNFNLGGQLFADINHNSATDVTRNLWWRASGTMNGAKTWGKWHQIAFTDGNVASATKLATARTINGTSFDGTANITTARWGTARTVTIGNTGKSVDGSGNASWSLAEIGALGATANAVSATKLADNTAYTAWGQKFFENGRPKSISGQTLTLFKSVAAYTGGWAREVRVTDKDDAVLGAFGFLGSDQALSYAYIGKSYGSPWLVVTPSGNVGIGTTVPAYKLDVNGTARVTSLRIGDVTISYDSANKGLKVSGGGLYSESYISARGANTAGGSGGGGYNRLDAWTGYTTAMEGYVLSAKLGYELHGRVTALEGKNYLDALTLAQSGSGNAVTAVALSADKKTLTVTKGATFLTSISKAMVEGVLTGNITTHTHSQYALASSLGNYVTLNTAQTISGKKTFGSTIATAGNHGTWLSGATAAAVMFNGGTAIDSSSAWYFYNMKSKSGHVVAFGGLGDNIGFYTFLAGRTANGTDSHFTCDTSTGDWKTDKKLVAASFVRVGGTASQFLKADGSVDATVYAPYANLTSHINNTTVHITASERTQWNKAVTDTSALFTALEGKVDKVSGKGLSANDFTDPLLTKLNGIEAGANLYVHPSQSALRVTAATGRVVTAISVNTLGHVTSVSGRALTADDIPELAIAKISGLQSALDGKATQTQLRDYVTKGGVETITGAKTLTGVLTATATWIVAHTLTGQAATSAQFAKVHGLEIGRAGRDYMNFNEYAGVFNFYKTSGVYEAASGDGFLCARITESGITTGGTVHAGTGVWSEGYVSARGQNTSSDARLKTVLGELELSVADIARAPSVNFLWKSDGQADAGSIAQYWRGLCPVLAPEMPDGTLGLQYGKAALLSVISVAKKTVDTDKRIKALEKRVDDLERENKELRKMTEKIK